MFGFLLGEALRDLRRAGRVAVSAILLITLSLAALGAFWLLSSNLGQAVAQWRDRVQVIVYLKREPAAAEAPRSSSACGACRASAAVRYVGKAEALGTLKQVLGKDAAVADSLPQNPLPASLEITPTAEGATPEGARALVARLGALPEADEVGGRRRVGRPPRALASGCCGCSASASARCWRGAAILTVTTATTLVLHARRHEMEIMRLVGAPEHDRAPAAAAAGDDAGAARRRAGRLGPDRPATRVIGARARAARHRDARPRAADVPAPARRRHR